MNFHAILASAVVAAVALPAAAKTREKDLLAEFSVAKSADRIRLAPAVGRLKGRPAVDALLAALDFKKGAPRESAAIVDALGVAQDPRAVSELAAGWDYLRTMAMPGDLPPPLAQLRVRVLDALSRCGGDQAVAILSEAINDKDLRVVEESARGLGRLQVKDAVPALQQLAALGGSTARTAFEAIDRKSVV